VWIVSVGQHPKPRSIPAEHFEPRAPPIGEDKQSSLARIFPQTFRDQPVQTVEALAQITRLNGQQNLQTAGKTQHPGKGFSKARNNAAATGICLSSAVSARAPPANCKNPSREPTKTTDCRRP
jgi:hypothetical protein